MLLSSALTISTASCPFRAKITCISEFLRISLSSNLLTTSSSTTRAILFELRCFFEVSIIIDLDLKKSFELLGSVNLNVEPLPTSLSTVMFPPNFSIYAFEIESPKPAPSYPLDMDVSACRKRSKIISCISGLIPIPVSQTKNSTPFSLRFTPNFT